MVSKWIHIEQLGGDPWVLPIWAAVNDAVAAGRAEPITDALGERALHISTRLTFLPWIVRRVNEGAHALYRAARESDPHHEFTAGHEGVSLRVDDGVKYPLLADLDSLLFELNSVCELISALFEEIHAHAGQAMPQATVGPSIRRVLEQVGQDPSWFEQLDAHRNFFMHEGAPYVAVDTSNAPDDFDLLIMKKNLRNFEDPEHFVRLSEINDIVQGFARSRPAVQEHLRSLFV